VSIQINMQSYNRAYNTFTELWLHNRKTRT